MIRVPRFLLRRAAAPLLTTVAQTWRLEVRHGDRLETAAGGGRPILFVLWHEAIWPLLWHHRARDIGIVVSRGEDGEALARYARGLGYRTLSGSSSRGGAAAFRQALRLLEGRGTVAIAPDGPRGPRRTAKLGALAAAQRTGAMLVVVGAAARPASRLRSWDRFLVPWPFAAVRVSYGTPFGVEPGPEGLARGLVRLQAEFGALEGGLACPGAAPPIA